jgi:hypothetical protein
MNNAGGSGEHLCGVGLDRVAACAVELKSIRHGRFCGEAGVSINTAMFKPRKVKP